MSSLFLHHSWRVRAQRPSALCASLLWRIERCCAWANASCDELVGGRGRRGRELLSLLCWNAVVL